jgi:hypothetical protein
VHPPLGWLLLPSPAQSQAPGQGCCLAQPQEIVDDYCDRLLVSGLQRTQHQLTNFCGHRLLSAGSHLSS